MGPYESNVRLVQVVVTVKDEVGAMVDVYKVATLGVGVEGRKAVCLAKGDPSCEFEFSRKK